MGFTDQLTQLIVVVVVLILAYFGVMMWTKRVGKEGGTGGGGLFGLGGGSHTAPSASLGLNDHAAETEIPKSTDRTKGRFNLTGRDAEVAAKVLKRMLKQDKDEQEGAG